MLTERMHKSYLIVTASSGSSRFEYLHKTGAYMRTNCEISYCVSFALLLDYFMKPKGCEAVK